MADGLLLITAVADSIRSYGDFPLVGARGAVWIAAQVHLMFAAFVLGVPMFAVVAEAIGIFGKDPKYDGLAKEFTRLLLVAYSATAIWGAILVFLLATLYTKFWAYMTTIFGPSMWLYAGLFFFESFTLYLYYYGWGRWKYGRAKIAHWTLGILLNIWGTIVMLIANSWLTYMMTPPRDISSTTDPATIKLWHAIANATWMPINIHRLIANVVFGGAIAAAYASYRFLAATTDEERAYYDWMGYVGNFIAMAALIVLPFAGYWLGREIYQYDQSMGITMMGGFMSWLWVIQAFLIAVLFLAGNYYLWIGMGRIPGAERYRPYIKYLLIVLVLGALVWGTPHTMIADSKELAAMGGSHHPLLGALGVMSAKNTAVNLMILATFLSFLMYRRGNKQLVVPWAQHRDQDPGRNVRDRGGDRAVLRDPRILRRSGRPDRLQRLSGGGGPELHSVRHGDRRHDGTRRQGDGRDPMGEDARALAVCVVHPRRDVHLAHGTDGLRSFGHPPVLARLAGGGRHEQVRRHAGIGLCLANDQLVRADLPQSRRVRVLARRARRKVHVRCLGQGGPACGPLT